MSNMTTTLALAATTATMQTYQLGLWNAEMVQKSLYKMLVNISNNYVALNFPQSLECTTYDSIPYCAVYLNIEYMSR